MYASVWHIEYYRCAKNIHVKPYTKIIHNLLFNIVLLRITSMYVDTPFTSKKYYVCIKYIVRYVHK